MTKFYRCLTAYTHTASSTRNTDRYLGDVEINSVSPNMSPFKMKTGKLNGRFPSQSAVEQVVHIIDYRYRIVPIHFIRIVASNRRINLLAWLNWTRTIAIYNLPLFLQSLQIVCASLCSFVRLYWTNTDLYLHAMQLRILESDWLSSLIQGWSCNLEMY